MIAEREPWRRTKEGVVVSCRLTPKGGRDAIDGVAELADGSSVLKARVRSAPQGGEANQALCALLAERLGAPGLGREGRRGLEEPAQAGRGFGRSGGPRRQARSAARRTAESQSGRR